MNDTWEEWHRLSELPEFDPARWPGADPAVLARQAAVRQPWSNEKFYTAIRSGLVLFHWRQSMWQIAGPVEVIDPQAVITVTCHDGVSTLQVVVRRRHASMIGTYTHQGLTYAACPFRPASLEEQETQK